LRPVVRFEMRFDTEVVERIEEWRLKQSDLPSRADAVRRLVELGLSAPKRKSVKSRRGSAIPLQADC
jgi:uncharacterized protein